MWFARRAAPSVIVQERVSKRAWRTNRFEAASSETVHSGSFDLSETTMVPTSDFRTMRSLTTGFSAAVVLMTAGAITIAAPPTPQQTFEQMDQNKDGKLTLNEIPPPGRPLFSQTDTDGNRSISLDEFVGFLRRTVDPNATATSSRDPSETVRPVLNLPYADTGHERQRLDLYLPKSPRSKRVPLIVFIHGGGWISGSKDMGRMLLLPYVASGEFAGASIAYRFSSDAPWPAQIHDCKAAIRWLRGHAAEYGIDPDRIGVIGTSAGGHLVSMLGTSGGIAELEGTLGSCLDESSEVLCVVNYCGPSNLLTVRSNNNPKAAAAIEQFLTPLLGGPLTARTDTAREASPVTYISAKDPPFLIVHGTNDELVPYDQSFRFQGALRAGGVDALLVTVRGGTHGNILVARGVSDRVRLFFERHLLDRKVTIPSGPVTAAP